MSDFDVVAYLASKGHRGRAASGGREMVYACFFDCGEAPDSKKKKLYFSVDEGFYDCKVCGISGGTYTLQKHFGDEPRTGTSDDSFMRRRILDAATGVGESMLQQNDDVLLYLLNERGLSPETIVERKLGFVTPGWSLVGSLPEGVTPAQVKSTGLVHRDGTREGKDFFYKHVLIPYLSHGHTLQIRGRAWGEISGGKYFTGPGEPVRIYNVESLEGAEEVIITEGEFDCMILAQALAASTETRLRKIAVIALPGTNAVPEEFNDLLSGAKRIYLGFDSDIPGTKAAETLKDKLGQRARILALPFDDGRKCDWTEYLLPDQGTRQWKFDHPFAGHDWRDIQRLLTNASGKRLRSIFEAGADFRSFRKVNAGLKTGFAELDQAILPGLLPGQVVVYLAKTGAGKTVLLCNLTYNMRAKKIMFVSLEMTREEVYERLRRIYLFHNPEASDDQVEQGLSNVYICDENRLGEKDIALLVNEFTVETDSPPDVVIIDYLGYYARGIKGNSPYEKATNAVMQLKQDAKAGRYVAIAPSQVNRVAKEGKPIDLDDARDSGAVEETADFLMSLYRPDDANAQEGVLTNVQPSGRVMMSLLKSRHGGKGKSFALQMDLLTLAVVSDGTAEARRARSHNDQHWGGLTWDTLRMRETAPIQGEFEALRYVKNR